MDGNKLRDALRKARVFIDCSPLKKVENDFGCIDRDEICAEIDAILAEPLKNCEVGTVEQQAKRFEEYCESEVCKRKRCKSRAKALCIEHCALEWAQKPYKVGGEK